MTIPNFRAMSHSALMDFWHEYHCANNLKATKLIGTQKGAMKAARTLANYACNLAVVMTCAARGDHEAAAIYTHAVRLCLERLPEDVRARVIADPWEG